MLLPITDVQQLDWRCSTYAGKSSLAQQLASRFNMPNVLQTDMFYEVGQMLTFLARSAA